MSDGPPRSQPVIVDRAAIRAGETRHYPLETIPDDIVREIFLQSLPAHGSVQPSRYSVPLVLAQICARWREVSLGTVQLWNSVDFTLPHSEGIVQLLHTWFRRAKAHPLSLTVRCPRACVVLPAGLIPLIKKYAPQFSSLALSVPSSQWAEFISAFSGPFPTLRHLSLHIQTQPGYPNQTEVFPAFADMPQLEELHIHIISSFSSLRIRSKTLTTLKLMKPIDIEEFEEIFRSLPNLRYLSLPHVGMRTPRPAAITYPLPLESLCLSAALYLDAVTLPHLRNLDVVLHNLPAITALCYFISRSGCTLVDLTLRDHVTHPFWAMTSIGWPLTAVFQAIPSLTSLRLHFTGNSGIRTIYSVLQSTTILPSLQHLAIGLGTPYLAIVESLPQLGDTMMASPHTPSYYTPVVIRGGSGVTYTYGYEYDRVASMLSARAPGTQLKSFSFTLQPTFHFLQANNPIAAEPFIPCGAPAAKIAQLQGDGLDVRVRVPLAGAPAPTIYWPSRGAEDAEILAFPACEGGE
ncbi:hypothetical protein FB45DRAFT_943009 [Roridomyces roridus]|uniref:F-box domain-containing protein n=1 Tax=Roridomyces roridus TaxID=1738132 RepID=A0AAD7B4C6_9AGAR|nr:hypothetical protein FB45DRAFT_943009 [Roridomyces roridus]